MKHSIISPSEANIWAECTGYPGMKLRYPPRPAGNAAAAGTESHQRAAQLITGAVKAASFEDDAAKIYAQDVLNTLYGRKNYIHGVETFIEAPMIHPQSYGTVDAYARFEDERLLVVWDFKHGMGIVEPYENWQLINYAAVLYKPGYTVELRIVQPRAPHPAGPIRSWRPDDFPAYMARLAAAAAEVFSEKATLRSGSHCRYCPARHACPAAIDAALGIYEAACEPLPIDMPPEAMGNYLSVVDRGIEALTYLKSTFQDKVAEAIRQGVNVPGWCLASAKGRRKWSRPVEEIMALGDALGVDLRKPGLVTPLQAKDMGLSVGVITSFSEVEATSLKLMPDDTKRAKRIFK